MTGWRELAHKPKLQYGFPITAWRQAKIEALEIIVQSILAGEMICYSDLAAQIEAIEIGPHDPRFGWLLGELSVEENERGRGMVSVWVVHKYGDRMPGAGFFELADELGRDASDELACWAKEVAFVESCWRKKGA